MATNALPIDQGTNVRAAMPARGSVGMNVGESRVNPYDREIKDTVGRKSDGTLLSLVELMHAREIYVRRAGEHAAYPFQSGADRLRIEELDKLIAEAQSQRGRATNRLRKLVHRNKKLAHGKNKRDGAGAPSKKQLMAAIKDALQSGLISEQLKPHDAHESYQQILLQDSIEIMIQHAVTAYENLLQAAKRPSSPVTNEQLSKGILDLIELVRRQPSPNADTDFGLNTLMIEALDIKKQRDETAVKETMERFRSGDPKAREELSQVFMEVNSSRRQSQLLGVQDTEVDSRVTEEMTKAIRIDAERNKAALRGLIDNAKHGGKELSKEELDKVLMPLLTTEQQMEMRGISNDNEMQEIFDLIAAASKK